MRLGKAIKLMRMVDNLDQARAAEVIGIGKSTLGRLEAGKGCDAAALVKIIAWLTEDEAASAAPADAVPMPVPAPQVARGVIDP